MHAAALCKKAAKNNDNKMKKKKDIIIIISSSKSSSSTSIIKSSSSIVFSVKIELVALTTGYWKNSSHFIELKPAQCLNTSNSSDCRCQIL